MDIRRYLPSAKLVSIVLALGLSVGLVFAADTLTRRAASPASVGVDSAPAVNPDSGWEAALYAVQAQTASSSFPTPDPNFVQNLLQAAQSSNVTESVGKTILINLSNAKSQGLGDDIPTQDQIIAAAAAQIHAGANVKVYTVSDLHVVEPTTASLHTYGNALIQVFNKHPAASQSNTFTVIGAAVDTNDPTQLQKLAPIQSGYAALTADLLALPVPQTVAPFHLLVLNDFARITASYDGMQVMLTDPLQGIAGFQTYQSSLTEVSRVFTNIAQSLSKGGILFTKDEPGSAWAGFLSP